MSVDEEINIKHRLTGAAILIALGVIIIPLLLGSYSGHDSGTEQAVGVKPRLPETSENTSFKNIEQGNFKVFVSKIRPVDSKNKKAVEEVLVEEQPKKVVAPDTSQASKSTTGAKSEDDILKEKLAAAMNKPLIKRKTSSEPIQSKTAEAEKVSVKSVERKPTAPKPAISKSEIVKEGYIVSVGVYSKPANAENVMKRLVGSGFNPTKRIVNTSKGKLPRVWLGPFATRAEAGKKKQLLQKRLGELGAKTLIKRYP